MKGEGSLPKIRKIHAREILDSRGYPTLEVDLEFESKAWGRAAVPSGASTGSHEAYELRDGQKERFLGKGVLKAITHINKGLADKVVGTSFSTQRHWDQALIAHDGTPNKANCGANAILGASMAFARALASEVQKPLFECLGENTKLPVPLVNILNGGVHANNALDVQEVMLVPVLKASFRENLRAVCEIFQHLKILLDENSLATSVGDEGGLAPQLSSNEEALDFVARAIERAGYRLGDEIQMALDVAATELFKEGVYRWESQEISVHKLGEIYQRWIDKYPLISIEDGFSEDDWEGWKWFTKSHGKKIQLVGDDLFVTQIKRLERGIEQKTANSILIKVNQTGTLTEAYDTTKKAQEAGFTRVLSHRSGETEDTTIADLAVAWSCQQIKTGSPCRGERTAKYNQLLRIEEILGSRAEFWGRDAFLR